MKALSTIAFATLLAVSPSQSTAQTARVGDFDRQVIALAYYRSPLWAAELKQHREELAEAKRVNDTEKIRSLNQWGGEAQELAHQQVFGNAPIPNILEALKPALAAIEKEQNLSDVVPVEDPGKSADMVDVTPQLLDWLKADAQTRALIVDLQAQRK